MLDPAQPGAIKEITELLRQAVQAELSRFFLRIDERAHSATWEIIDGRPDLKDLKIFDEDGLQIFSVDEVVSSWGLEGRVGNTYFTNRLQGAWFIAPLGIESWVNS